MPVRLSELRTLIADSVRLQRVQELQQGAARTNQDALTAKFREVLDDRRSAIRETTVTDRARIQPDESDAGGWAGASGAGAEGQEEGAQEEEPGPAAAAEGLGGIIDLRG